MTYLMVKGVDNGQDPKLVPGSIGALLIGESYCFGGNWRSPDKCTGAPLYWYISPDYYLFFIAFSTSIISSSLGLARCLKIGPCLILAQSWLCSPRFALLFFSVCFTLTGKGLALGYAQADPHLKANFMGLMVALATMFLPVFLLAFYNICNYKQSIRDVSAHPSLLLLPTVTNFTFAAK